MSQKNTWEYIQRNLELLDLSRKDLEKILGVTSQAIDKWKKGDEMARDKKILLSRLFGVTIDDFHNHIISPSLINKKIKKLKNKKISAYSEEELYLIVEGEKFVWNVIHKLLDKNETYEEKIENKNLFGIWCEYFSLRSNFRYNPEKNFDVPDDKTKTIGLSLYQITFEDMEDIANDLYDSWEENDLNKHFHYVFDKQVIDIILLSENLEFIKNNRSLITSKIGEEKVLEKYFELKKKNTEFDPDKEVLKELICMSFYFYENGIPSYEKTLKELIQIV